MHKDIIYREENSVFSYDTIARLPITSKTKKRDFEGTKNPDLTWGALVDPEEISKNRQAVKDAQATLDFWQQVADTPNRRAKAEAESKEEAKKEETKTVTPKEEAKTEEKPKRKEKSEKSHGQFEKNPHISHKYVGWQKRDIKINTEDYEPTDEFRELQESCQGRDYAVEYWRARKNVVDSGDWRRLADIFRGQLDAAGSSAGLRDELLTLTNFKTEEKVQVSFRKNVSGKLFHDIFQVVRQHLKFGDLVDLHDDYSDCICYITEDGLSGFAIEQDTGNAVSGFNLSPYRGFMRALSPYMRSQGATHGDCYASSKQNLIEIYQKVLGAKVVATVDYNMAYDENGKGEFHDNPVVGFFVLPGEEISDDYEVRHFDKDGYDAARDYTLSLLENKNETKESKSENNTDQTTEETQPEGETPSAGKVVQEPEAEYGQPKEEKKGQSAEDKDKAMREKSRKTKEEGEKKRKALDDFFKERSDRYGVPVRVAHNAGELRSLCEEAHEPYTKGMERKTEAFTKNGVVYVYAPTFFRGRENDPDAVLTRAAQVFNHEAFGHIGLKQMMDNYARKHPKRGKTFNQFCAEVFDSMSKEAQEAMLAYQWDNNLNESQRRALLSGEYENKGEHDEDRSWDLLSKAAKRRVLENDEKRLSDLKDRAAKDRAKADALAAAAKLYSDKNHSNEADNRRQAARDAAKEADRSQEIADSYVTLKMGAADEYCAHLAERVMNDKLEEENRSVWQRFVDAVKRFFGIESDGVTDKDIAKALMQSREKMAEGAGEESRNESSKETVAQEAETEYKGDLADDWDRLDDEGRFHLMKKVGVRQFEGHTSSVRWAELTEDQQSALRETAKNNGNLIAESKERVKTGKRMSVDEREYTPEEAEMIVGTISGLKDVDSMPEKSVTESAMEMNDARFSMKEDLERDWKDKTPEQRGAALSIIKGLHPNEGERFSESKLQKAAYFWMVKRNTVRLPEDGQKVRDALRVCESKGVNFQDYNSPMEVINQFGKPEPTKKEHINPDMVSTLSNKKEYPDGLTVYDVEDSDESRQNMREIINSHLGKDRSPWCLLQGDGSGSLTEDSQYYWEHYDKYPKRVAFQNGRLLAFFASDDEPTWWDTQDAPHHGISVSRKMPADKLGRSATYEFDEKTGDWGDPTNIHRGNRQNGVYEEWTNDGRTLIARSHWKGGKLDGTSESWNESGQKRTESEYRDGKRDGVSKILYANTGTLNHRVHYRNGTETGLAETWYENGQLFWRVNFKDGVYDGLFESWNMDGSLASRRVYKDGDVQGLEEDYYGTDRIISDPGYANERMVTLEPDGKIKKASQYGLGFDVGLSFSDAADWLEKNGYPVERRETENGVEYYVGEREWPVFDTSLRKSVDEGAGNVRKSVDEGAGNVRFSNATDRVKIKDGLYLYVSTR